MAGGPTAATIDAGVGSAPAGRRRSVRRFRAVHAGRGQPCQNRTRLTRRLTAATAVLATVVLVASCAPGSGDDEARSVPNSGSPSASSGAGTHGGHGAGAIPPAAPLRAGERFANLTMPQPYTPAAPNGGTDEYRCFLVDPKMTERRS